MNIAKLLFQDIKRASLEELTEEIIPELEHAIINQHIRDKLTIRLLSYARKRRNQLIEGR